MAKQLELRDWRRVPPIQPMPLSQAFIDDWRKPLLAHDPWRDRWVRAIARDKVARLLAVAVFVGFVLGAAAALVMK